MGEKGSKAQEDGQEDGPPQEGLEPYLRDVPVGRISVLEWVQDQREHTQQIILQEQQLQRERLEREAGMDAVSPFTSIDQGFGNPRHALGPQPYATGVTGAAGLPQPPSSLPSMFHGNQLPNYNNANVPVVPFAHVPARPSHPPAPQPWLHGAGVLNVPQQGQQPFQELMFLAPRGNQGNHQGSGADWHLGQVAHPPGNLQPRDLVPLSEAPSTPANTKQAAGGQPSLKRPAGGEPPGTQPALKRTAVEESVGEQRNTSDAPTNTANLSVSELLDRGRITDATGLNKQEVDELLLWARRKGIKWREIHRRFKFELAESTLRVRYRNLVKSQPPKVPEFTERDIELLLEAVENIAGGPLDDVDGCKIPRLWLDVQQYISKHGGTTHAGPGTLKKKYKELTKNTPGIRKGLKQSEASGEHQAYENGNTRGQEQVTLDGGAEQEEPSGEPGTLDYGANSPGMEPNELEWDHKEYEQFEVEYEDGADFGEDDEDDEDDED